ncbi:MAG: ribosomal-processing cysteine protease Prp [Clostridiales bacterium]|nr:ribosomal-processing cysteine protease Prp [Candidatus Apopatousia equi]
MTDIKIFKLNKNIKCIQCLGHSGYAEKGEDIVCAGISSIVQTAVLGLLTVAKINVELLKDDETGYLKAKLPENLTEEENHDAQVILNTMLCGLSDLRETYSNFINLEVIENVY